MTATLSQPEVSPDDLLSMGDDNVAFELVNGELVEKTMGWESSWIASELAALLRDECRRHRPSLGWALGGEATYQCFDDDPEKVRRPDASFIARGRLPGGRRPKGHCRVAPDLAVEVVSPNDTYSHLEEKVAEYLGAGVRLVWVIDPPTKTVRVHRADGSTATLHSGDELSGEEVIVGFRCRVADLFDDGIDDGSSD